MPVPVTHRRSLGKPNLDGSAAHASTEKEGGGVGGGPANVVRLLVLGLRGAKSSHSGGDNAP